MKIRVPATSANVGCGFDSLGFAVSLYLEVTVLEESPFWQVIHDLGDSVPIDDRNLIVATALKVAPNLEPRILRVTNQVPLERGLGSSSTAIVAGIQLADLLGSLQLSLAEKLALACEFEGHPDNVVPAFTGGFVVASYLEGRLSYVKMPLPDMALVAVVPHEPLSTQKMREILPASLSHQEAAAASAVANAMIAHLWSGQLKEAGQLMESDRLHEPFRSKLIPLLQDVRLAAKEAGAYATYLSGAGSTIMILLPKSKQEAVTAAVKQWPDTDIMSLEFDALGCQVL